jgi:uncharacterized RDD family membrane protein YckC
MRRRLGAWLIDSIAFVLIELVFLQLVEVLGAVTISPDVEAQFQTFSMTLPATNPFHTNLPLLATLGVVCVAINVGYATAAWALFRALPGQRLLSLQVGSADTGRNLSVWRALVRSVVAIGLPVAAFWGIVVAFFAMTDTLSWSVVRSAIVDDQASGSALAWLGLLGVLELVAFAWPVILLIWTAASLSNQGLHDRLAGSLVVGNASRSWAAGSSAPRYGPAYGPGYGGDPGYLPPGFIGPAASPDSSPGATDAGAGGTSDGEPWRPPLPNTPFGNAEPRPHWSDPDRESDAPAAVHTATVGRRVSAYLLDSVLLSGLFFAAVGVVASQSLPAGQTVLDERTYIFAGLGGGIGQLAYFVLGWRLLRGTLAQRVMHLRVTDATTGKALGWMDAVVRWATLQGPFALLTIAPEAVRSYILPAAAVWMGYLLYATMNDPDRRGPHDKFLNSRVTLEL